MGTSMNGERIQARNRRRGLAARFVVAGVIGGLAVTSVGPALGATDAPRQHSAAAAASLPAASQLPREAASARALGFGAIAAFVGRAIAGAAIARGTTWLMDELRLNPFEDPTQVRLDQLSAQLDALSGQVAETQARVDRLTADVHRAELNAQLRKLRRRVNQIQSLYKTVYLPVMDRAQDLTDAIRRGDDPTAAQRRLDKARSRFVRVYDSNLAIYGPLGRDIHEFLVPGAATSVLKAKGLVLMNRHRYLTSAQSAPLRQLYVAMADQEALAVWMKAERYVALDRRVYKRTIANYGRWKAKERKHLAPLIPADTVIDVGRHARTTNNHLMWMPGGKGLDWMANPPTNWAPTVKGTLARMNKFREAGMVGWRRPTRNEVTKLYERTTFRPGTDDLLPFLRGLNPGSSRWQDIVGQAGGAWQWIASGTAWSPPIRRWHIACEGQGKPAVWLYYPKASFWALGTYPGWSRWHPRPELSWVNRFGGPPSQCHQWIARQLHNPLLRAGTLAARNTGNMAQDYMAQGAGKRPKR